jgi:glutaredoxin
MPELTFYFMPTCPFCQKVVKYLEQNDIIITKKNTAANSQTRQELLAIGGKTQVPCLVIDGNPLYESDDIIQWFKANYRKSVAGS